MRTRSTSPRRLATELQVTTTIGIPQAEGGGSPRSRADRAPAEVPGRARHGLGAAAALRADDDRGEGALGLGRVPAPAAGGGPGGGVPRAAGQAGGDGAVARDRKSTRLNSSHATLS